MKKRTLAVLAIFTVFGFCTLIFRLFGLQIKDFQKYQALANSQQLSETVIAARRGTIYDCNLKPLAQSATVWKVSIWPAYIENDEQAKMIAQNMTEILGLDYENALKKCTDKSVSYAVLKSKVEKEQADEVRKFKIDNNVSAIGLEEDNKRYYPYSDFASTVIGFTGTDNQGLAGIEAYYDSILKGKPGVKLSAKNAWGTDMPVEYEKLYDAENGNNLVLTIDEVIQHFLEKHLETAVVENKVFNRACGIVMNVKTGEILGMSTKNDYDCNEPFEIRDARAKEKLALLSGDELSAQKYVELQAQWRNKAISDPYEPGSVFKIITAAAALEENVVNDTETFRCTGAHTVAGTTIRCWKLAGHGTETFSDGVKNSCNPVFMQVGARLGAVKFYQYFEAFGLTQKTGIDLPGEATSIYHQLDNIGPVQLASSSFGQTFKVTPMQIMAAVGAAVNGGYLVEPHLVKQILDDDMNVVETISTNVKRQVISNETSKKLCTMLERVVSEGSGRNAYVMGYRIGGKTGTSEKLDAKDENGNVTQLIVSFLGFAPADDPEIAVLVMLDDPHNMGDIYGSTIAAPVVGNILADILPYIGVEPQYTSEEISKMDIRVPNVMNLKPSLAKSKMSNIGLKATIIGNGEKVVKQVPSGGKAIPSGGTVILYTEIVDTEKTTTVPNVLGYTASIANRMMTNAGLNIKITGGGVDQDGAVAVKQSITEGTKVPIGTTVTVEFLNKEYQDETYEPTD